MARRPREPFILDTSEISDDFIEEVMRPMPESTDGLLHFLSRQSGGIPEFARDALVRGGLDAEMIARADRAGRTPTPPAPSHAGRIPKLPELPRARQAPPPPPSLADEDTFDIDF